MYPGFLRKTILCSKGVLVRKSRLKQTFLTAKWNFCQVSRVLGIETSCDDTAVAIVDSNRHILSSRRYNDNTTILEMGGIYPYHFAQQHRNELNRLVDECIQESGFRMSDLDAIAVSSRPGMVISLKVGIDKALSLARDHYLKLIPIHHMRAHAMVARLFRLDLKFPFVTLLISGGHSLIVLVNSAEDFQIIGESASGSPGECLDKLARTLGLQPTGPHFASELEKLALRADEDGYLKYLIKQPSVAGANFNFSHIKGSYENLISRVKPSHNDLPNFCASIQFSVMSHLCKKLDLAFQFLDNREYLENFKQRHLVVAGGVASNSYFINCIRKLAKMYDFETIVPPRYFCTDNGEMIAWLGIELLLSSSKDILYPSKLPESVIAHKCVDIGINLKDEVSRQPSRRLNAFKLHNC